MDMTDLDEIFGLNNYKWSNYYYQSSDLEDVLSELRCLLPNEQEGSNVMQPGPSSVNDPCGEPPIKGSNTNKYNKIPKQCDRRHGLIDHCEKDQRRIYKCKQCDYGTNRKNNLKRHEETHIRKRPTYSGGYMCTEPGCNKIYKNKYSLMIHMTYNHNNNKMESNNMEPEPSAESNLYGRKLNEKYKVSRQCRVCGQIFCNKKMLIDHSMKVHQCCVHICEDETCNYETNVLQNMRKHFVAKHMNNKN
ncbi:zinc finger protein 671-like [Harpegnathos saltator]|uniref:zinc finger protein 671 n=1 Tax=Harpegnathos saltator TaxID=610380 RepID=UPI00058F74EA|nr:zinc finger protein 671 [Harpegnathos saltator]XP_025160979.1 zinc finger protein 671-like [Harpegnathos saltator]